MNEAEIDSKFKAGFSLFEGYKTIELIPEPENNEDNLLWLWCYDANLMPLSFAGIDKKLRSKVVMELLNCNSLKSVPIDIVIDGLQVVSKGKPIKPRKYEEDD